MCSITAHYKQQPTYVENASSGGGRAIPKNATLAELQSLGATLNFIDFWLKNFQHNYQVRLMIYHEAMIKMFKQILTMKQKPLNQDKKTVAIDRYCRCVVKEKIIKNLPPLRKQNLSKK